MPKVEIYTKSWCGYCARVKSVLNDLGVAYEEIDVTTDTTREQEMVRRAHRTSVPQVFFNDHHVGGSDDLTAVIDSGEYDRLITASNSALSTQASDTDLSQAAH